MKPNGYKKDRYIWIFSNMIDLPAKDTFYANQVYAAGIFYDDKMHKIGGGKVWLPWTADKDVCSLVMGYPTYL